MFKKSITSVSADLKALPLKVDGLYKKYSEKAPYAVENVSFECRGGEILSILGANGAGKSSTLKCITGMLPLSAGTITVGGLDIEKQPVAAKSQFSFVTDNHSVFTKMTGTQYLDFMADVYRVPAENRAAIVQKLESVFQLSAKINELISDYSHGMKQKICMMGSLMHSPRLWILDEPMVGLDPRTQNAVINFMKSYVKQGNAILFSSHNLDTVRRVCDRVVVIEHGRLIDEIIIDDNVRQNPHILDSYYFDADTDGSAEGTLNAADIASDSKCSGADEALNAQYADEGAGQNPEALKE